MRVYMDGVFDIFHFGHANGLRQAKSLGNVLVVGVNSSSSAAENKNKPIMSDEERIKVIQSCKWADEVIGEVSFILSMQFVIDHNYDPVAHGDDVIIDSAGIDCYAEAKKRNMFATFGRTEYVSTTNLVGRIMQRKGIPAHINETRLQYYEHLRDLFYAKKERKGNKIVYVDGSFDLYHAGHVSIIEEAKKNGDYLIIGLHNDKDIIKEKGLAPIMNEKERMLVLYSNKHVDEIVFDAPFYPDKEFIDALCISKIYCGKDGSKYYKDVNT